MSGMQLVWSSRFTGAYVDDCIIHGKNFNDHYRSLENFFRVLRKANIGLNLSKTILCAQTFRYLGFECSMHPEKGSRPSPDLVDMIKAIKLEEKATKKRLRSIMGLLSSYHSTEDM